MDEQWKGNLKIAMTLLAEDSRVVFLGQQVRFPGHIIYETLEDIPEKRRLEMPVAEELQTGIAIGLALAGWLPISCYPRMDFLLLAMNQLVNHLDKMEEMSRGQFVPKVIIRTMKGKKEPLDPGPQHSQDHVASMRMLLHSIPVWEINTAEKIVPTYREALAAKGSVLIVEAP